MSRIVVTREDIAELWRTTARLQEQAGKPELAAQSRKVAKQTTEINGWVRNHGIRT